jgi:hypothetical protein
LAALATSFVDHLVGDLLETSSCCFGRDRHGLPADRCGADV